MRMLCLTGLCLVLAACPAPQPPAPPPPIPDADGAPAPAPPGPVSTKCAAACLQLAKLGCPGSQDQAACGVAMTHEDTSATVSRPDGFPVNCDSVATAASKDAMRAAGVDCP